MVTIDSVLVQDTEPLATTVEDDVVLLSMRAGSYFGLNRVGTEIWNMLAVAVPVRHILDRLSQAHEVDAATMTRDVTAFLQTLIDRRLVRMVGPEEAR